MNKGKAKQSNRCFSHAQRCAARVSFHLIALHYIWPRWGVLAFVVMLQCYYLLFGCGGFSISPFIWRSRVESMKVASWIELYVCFVVQCGYWICVCRCVGMLMPLILVDALRKFMWISIFNLFISSPLHCGIHVSITYKLYKLSLPAHEPNRFTPSFSLSIQLSRNCIALYYPSRLCLYIIHTQYIRMRT